MKVIGITGGVGAGKTTVINEIKKMCNCKVIIADELAKSLQEPGKKNYLKLVELLGEDILSQAGGPIDNKKMAQIIFSDATVLKRVNDIVHPGVKEEILSIIDAEAKKGQIDFLFIEAALLIEEGYGVICDNLWYIYTDMPIRRERLKQSRGYSDEKIDSIVRQQMSDEDFIRHCDFVINNNGDLDKTVEDIKKALKG